MRIGSDFSNRFYTDQPDTRRETHIPELRRKLGVKASVLQGEDSFNGGHYVVPLDGARPGPLKPVGSSRVTAQFEEELRFRDTCPNGSFVFSTSRAQARPTA